MKKIFFLIELAFVIGCFTLEGCTLLEQAGKHLTEPEQQTIRLELPAWPDYLPELTGWQIELQQAGNSKIIDATSLSIRVPRNKPLCIIAQPLVLQSTAYKSGFFKCAGGLYPYMYSSEQETLKLTWQGGFAATLMKSIIISGEKAGYSQEFTQQTIAQFNWERLVEILEENQAQQEPPWYNPWLLNMQQVLEGIAWHNFSATKLKMSGTLDVELEFPVFSSYIPENEKIRESEAQGQRCVTIKKDNPSLFALADGQFSTGILIYGTSVKNISLEFISLPIYINEEI